MKNIENYKTRFSQLMESTMGDVKPLISEQAPSPTPTVKPSGPNPPKEGLMSKYLNQTVNLYTDQSNTKLFKARVKIKKISKAGDGNTNLSIIFENLGDYSFDCKTKTFELKSATMTTKYYNKNLADNLSKDFCTKSSGGVDVPKATFASTNLDSTQGDMT